MPRGRRPAADACAVAALLFATLLLYRHVLDLFWLYDTPFHLRLLADWRPRDFFVSHDFWRQEKNVFTPLLYVSLWIDRACAGLSPVFFHAHQLAAIGLSAVGLYATLRLWLTPGFAAAGGGLFLAGPCVAVAAPLLMVRHYFEALLLASLAVFGFVVALRRNRPAWTLASAALFFAALLAKEIAAPVLVLLALLPESGWRKRLAYLAPHAAALAGYAAYRAALLERPLAGHGWIEPGGLAQLAASFAGKAFRAFAFDSPRLAAGLALLLACALAALPWRWFAALAATIVASLLLALPVAVELPPRLLLGAWFGLAGAAACGWSHLASRPSRERLALGLATATLLATIAAGRTAWAKEIALARRMSAENRAFLELEGGSALRYPAAAAATLGELRRLLPRPGAAGAPVWYQDDLYLCSPRPELRRIWSFDPASAGVRDITPAALAEAAGYCRSIRWQEPLSARFWWRGDGLYWQLGDYPAPGYSVVVDEGVSRIAVPRSGAYSWESDAITLRVRYEDPAGWVTYSPPLALARRQGETRWERPGPAR